MAGMRTVDEIRRENLEQLAREAGTMDAVAERVGSNPVYLSQVRTRMRDSKTGTPRSLGTKMARRLEKAFDKPKGWMDEHHGAGGGQWEQPSATPRGPAPELTYSETELVLAYRQLPLERRKQLRLQVMEEAARYETFAREVLARYGATEAVAADALPQRPDGDQPDTEPGKLPPR